jgi:2-polyprenyl-3-methyl-5-hydroxy-6-metoxy-1,4-benzoquinol methylase
MIKSLTFFEQEIKMTNHMYRIPYFLHLISNKKVLHIGCADWPIYNPNNNLHVILYQNNNNVEGFDVNKEVIEQMKTHPSLNNAKLYSILPDEKYDFLLIPETIEHVNNVEGFLLSILKCITRETQILITGPNAYHFCSKERKDGDDLFIEMVHPDHNCWYSPYTLPNTIRKVYKNNNIESNFLSIGTLENDSMVYCLFTLNI